MKPKHTLIAGLVAALTTLLINVPAQAALSTDVTVKLIAPGGLQGDSTPIDLTQVAPLATGILAANLGGSGDISGMMLDNEKIVFSGNSIELRVAAGFDDGLGNFSTGYLGSGGSHARYVLSGLDIAGQTIVGFSAYAFDGFGNAGFAGLLSPANPTDTIQLLSPSSVSFNLDDLQFKDRGLGGSGNFAEFRIDLVTQPVPEPSTLALFVAGGLAVVGVRRLAQGKPAPDEASEPEGS